ncbi:AttF component of AttEFGH ABC transport system / AttG component of AttEFGH ABC transport system [Vibrio chagasii]|nr:AttF component of AttEFGH ABC transport system / AttG component of AttEFGH ABC transport system [Vibrio chagasii]CAH6835481.1 AttF component of AttEFGH ABC transport system / AttG component of AttEFGH ABC transport system [Vibrio chagasii]CAH6982646.1 AttF component of AttEFGH ABC transport system / AttG component of AttEFGH ABC transport system [Vibrio chagasii]CAH7015297.1 AttF component of AttEFGH ABC transport system / AttG component of AttEFGH ABC transport system [Vibrio chagasii]CAH70
MLKANATNAPTRLKVTHTKLTLNLFAAHYRHSPLQAAAILIGIVLAVTLFVAVQAINLNAKRSYAESTEQLSAQAQNLIIPPAGQNYLPESLYFKLRQNGLSAILPVIEGRVRDEQGRRWSIQGSELIAALTSRFRYSEENEQSISLFDNALPLPQLLAGKPIVMMSQSQHQSLDEVETLILDDIVTQVVVLPDEWQLGSRMLMDIGFAQQLLNKQGQLSYIAVFNVENQPQDNWQSLIAEQGQWITNNQSTDLGSITDSFHLNLTAMSLLAFLVGLFIAYNGVKYSLLKRNRLLVQIQQAGVAPSMVFSALLIELTVLVTLGALLGFILGIQLSHWLHPTVAITLEQLYGATLLPGTWQWSWLVQALLLTLAATLVACWQHFKQRIQQPLSSHGGFYQTPEASNENQLFIIGITLTGIALAGLWLSEHHRFTMAWLGVLVVSIPLYLPKTLSVLADWSEQRTQSGLMQYLFAELRELISPLSLAMMALLLAVTANMGMNTLVGSFESTLKQWLEQRLHADIYVSPAQGEIANVEYALEQFEHIETVYKQYYVDDNLQGLPTLLGTKDEDTLAQTMVFQSQLDNFWQRFYQGELVAISEPTAVKLGLSLNSELKLDSIPNKSLVVGAIFHDYGSPNGEVLLAPNLWLESGFTTLPTSLGVKVSGDQQQVYEQLRQQLNLHPSQLYDQAQIKSLALDIFSQTFAITRALNGVTLMVAVIGLFCACFMLLDARKAAIARLYALGVSRKKLMAMVLGQIVVLVTFTLVIAIPLGAMVGYVLTDIVTLRAFGWSLNYQWNWSDALSISVITIVVAVIATLIPLWRLVSKPVVSSLQSEVL